MLRLAIGLSALVALLSAPRGHAAPRRALVTAAGAALRADPETSRTPSRAHRGHSRKARRLRRARRLDAHRFATGQPTTAAIAKPALAPETLVFRSAPRRRERLPSDEPRDGSVLIAQRLIRPP